MPPRITGRGAPAKLQVCCCSAVFINSDTVIIPAAVVVCQAELGCQSLPATTLAQFASSSPPQNPSNPDLQVLRPLQRREQRIMVFCNTLDSCRAAEMHLQASVHAARLSP